MNTQLNIGKGEEQLQRPTAAGRVLHFLGFVSGRHHRSLPKPLRAVRQLLALCRALLSERGEVSGVRLATEALGLYQSMSELERAEFFDCLVVDFSPDPEEVGAAGDAYRADPSAGNCSRLQLAAEPPRQELFRRLNMAPGGTAQLVEMRRSLLAAETAHPSWAPVEADLAHLLNSWFNRGFLSLQRIDWRTPAIVLEKLIRYEAVHEIRGWRDLRRRLEADRRCYAFFHPALPDEPIIFIEVALTRGVSRSVQPLVDPSEPISDPKSANCAVFYSITNCQEGLRGVPFGSFLIKKVAEDLARELPRIRTFSTLSPAPGFRRWLESGPAGLSAAAQAVAARVGSPEWTPDRYSTPDIASRGTPAGETPDRLSSLCAHYLLHAKRGSKPMDPVARFHLRNGARIDRVNYLADTSPAGLRSSAGFMVNYVYDLAEIEQNHELYTRDAKVSASRAVVRSAGLPWLSEAVTRE